MTKIFNHKHEKKKRRDLRNNFSEAERRLWLRLRNRQVLRCKFRRQYGIGRYVLDFYCPQLKLAIEVDGDSHYQPGVADYDHSRQRHIEALGIRFLRFTNTEVYKQIDEVVERIAETLQALAAGSKPSNPL